MPSFAIEAPAETVPLTMTALLQTLDAATSSNVQQIQSGTKQLQQWEKANSFYPSLQTAYIDISIPHSLRWLAIIQLKNGIDKYWRKTAPNTIKQDEKLAIRGRLIKSAVDETVNELLVQNALLISKIVRLEFPTDWPDALLEILHAVEQSANANDNDELQRILVVLLYVIKELSTGRLQRTRQNLQKAAPQVLATLSVIHTTRYYRRRATGTGSATADPDAAISLLALRIIRRLLIAGYDVPHHDEALVGFWVSSEASFRQLVETVCVSDVSGTADARHVMQLSKLYLNMARDHPASFIVLPNSMEIMGLYRQVIQHCSQTTKQHTRNAATESQNETSATERLAIHGVLITRACLNMIFKTTHTFKHRQGSDKEQESAAQTAARSRVVNGLFSDAQVCSLMELLVTKFFTFTPHDLEKWQLDAEEWEMHAEADSDAFEYSLRLSSEKLFLDLIINFKDQLLQPLSSIFERVADQNNPDMLLKDSVYSAMGLAASVYHQQIDFDSFLSNTLVREVQLDMPNCHILRRRIAIVIGQWAPVRLSQQNRPLVYQIFQHLLQPSEHNDLVVRITAGRHLKYVTDDWEFDVAMFLPFADNIMLRMIKLIEEVESTDTKMQLLGTMNSLVERMDHHIEPVAPQIVNLLPILWEQAQNEPLMQQTILALLTRLVNALKSASSPYHATFMPIIGHAIDPNSDIQVYLLEDALDLWLAIVTQSSPPVSQDLLQLLPRLLGLLRQASDSLRITLELCESYLLLCPQEILTVDTRRPILSAMADLLDGIKPEASAYIYRFTEIAIRSAHSLGGDKAIESLTSDLVSTNLMPRQLQGLHSAYLAHCTTGPHAKAPSVDGVIETDYFSILARLCLASTTAFMEVIRNCAPLTSGPKGVTNDSNTSEFEQKMKWLLEEWFSHLENIGDPIRRKLMCLALTKLLETNMPFILSQLQLLMTLWTDLIVELRDYTPDDAQASAADPMADSLVYGANKHDDSMGPPTPEELRRRGMSASDPVHTVKTAEWVKYYLAAVVTSVGSEARFQELWLVNVDKEVVQAFGQLGIM